MKHRTLLGIVCIALAFVTVFVLAPFLTQSMNGRVKIIRAVSAIEKGKQLTAADFEYATVGAYNLPDNVVRDVTAVLGQYAAVDIVNGSYILPAMITNESVKASDVITRLEDGEYAITIDFPSFAAGFAGELTNGDIVKIFAYDSQHKNTVEFGAFQYAEIITTVSKSGLNKDEMEPNEDGSYSTPSAIMLKVNETQAQLIVQYTNQYGNLHLVFVCHGDDERAKGYLDTQKKWFENNKSEEKTPETQGQQTVIVDPED